ncbi:MAG TPA: hypothetical protein V6D22_11650 [Candidatus Obscuribacterales bacterium]
MITGSDNDNRSSAAELIDCNHLSERKNSSPAKTVAMILGVVLWLVCAGWGFSWLLNFQSGPGIAARAPASWPAMAAIQPTPGRFTLVMFLHPRCPCSIATISELAVIMSHCRQLDAYAVFVKPKDYAEGWEKTKLWQQARATKGVTVLTDNLGVEATEFGAFTSGQVMLYNPQGGLVFSGGITSGRGHEGDSAGVDAVEAIVAGQPAQYKETSVFGCSLMNVANSGAVQACHK